jgi:hypothetical protein
VRACVRALALKGGVAVCECGLGFGVWALTMGQRRAPPLAGCRRLRARGPVLERRLARDTG